MADPAFFESTQEHQSRVYEKAGKLEEHLLALMTEWESLEAGE